MKAGGDEELENENVIKKIAKVFNIHDGKSDLVDLGEGVDFVGSRVKKSFRLMKRSRKLLLLA